MEESHRIFSVGVFWIVSILGVPLGIILSRAYRPLLHLFLCIMVVSLINPQWSITFFSEEYYKSATRGFEVHLADLMMLILSLSMLSQPKEFSIRLFPPLTLLTFLFLLISFISWLSIDHSNVSNFDRDLQGFALFKPGLYPLFEMTKILRGFFIYWVSVNYFSQPNNDKILITCLTGILLYFTVGALFYRYALHINRVSLPMFHVNDFNTLTGIVGVFLLPWAFASKKIYNSLLFWFLGCCAFVTIILTISRSSLAGYIGGGMLVTTFCMGRFSSIRNAIMILLAAFLGIVFLGKALGTLQERFGVQDTVTAAQGRSLVNDSAILMAKEHFFGIGLGNFSYASHTRYARLSGADPYNIAHNIWFLTLGEVGVLGLLIFILIWIRYYMILIWGMLLSLKKDQNRSYTLIVGVLCSSVVMQFQNLYHFSYRQTSVFFLTQILAGLAIRLYLDLRSKKS